MLIQNSKFKQSILTALADEDMVKILNSTQVSTKSVNDIIREYNIAHTTAYRKIKWMVENDLLVVEQIKLTEDGKKSSLFKSTFSSAKVNYENGEVHVDMIKNANKMKPIAERFLSLGDDEV
jgi:predicted transcriptional regulator